MTHHHCEANPNYVAKYSKLHQFARKWAKHNCRPHHRLSNNTKYITIVKRQVYKNAKNTEEYKQRLQPATAHTPSCRLYRGIHVADMLTRLTDIIGALQPPCSTHGTRSLQLPRSWGLCSCQRSPRNSTGVTKDDAQLGDSQGHVTHFRILQPLKYLCNGYS